MNDSNNPAPTRFEVVRDSELLPFLAGVLEISARSAKRILDSRAVFVNRRRVWMAKHHLKPGDVVETHCRPRAASVAGPPILFSDGRFLVVSKPAGILAVGTGSIEELVCRRLDPALRAAHRLDRNTSGCLLFCADREALEAAESMFRRRKVEKTYLAIVYGHTRRKSFEIRNRLDNRTALTRVFEIDRGREASLLRINIETGRTHQIRRHLASAGNPVVGDSQYGLSRGETSATITAARQMLHALSLEMPHPFSKCAISASAPLPEDFLQCLKRLGLGKKRGGTGFSYDACK